MISVFVVGLMDFAREACLRICKHYLLDLLERKIFAIWRWSMEWARTALPRISLSKLLLFQNTLTSKTDIGKKEIPLVDGLIKLEERSLVDWKGGDKKGGWSGQAEAASSPLQKPSGKEDFWHEPVRHRSAHNHLGLVISTTLRLSFQGKELLNVFQLLFTSPLPKPAVAFSLLWFTRAFSTFPWMPWTCAVLRSVWGSSVDVKGRKEECSGEASLKTCMWIHTVTA